MELTAIKLPRNAKNKYNIDKMEDTTYTKDLVLVNMHLKSKLEKPLKLSKRKEKPTKKSKKLTKFSPIKKLVNNTTIDTEKQ